MQIIRAANLRATSWKNGGGETREIAAHPPGASLAAFDWRVSMAHVGSDGPFSTFPGVDRTLTVLDGAGLRLAIDGGTTFDLAAGSGPCSFAADVPVTAALIDGPVTDLNVMTRRHRLRHRVRRLAVEGHFKVPVRGTLALVFCATGTVSLDVAGQTCALARHDTAQLDRPGPMLALDADSVATVCVIEIEPA